MTRAKLYLTGIEMMFKNEVYLRELRRDRANNCADKRVHVAFVRKTYEKAHRDFSEEKSGGDMK